ncbi:MAG: Archaeosortase [Euryarchaeota archaeon]|nr:Archaeosortase [Euryarchaeota archaeon]
MLEWLVSYLLWISLSLLLASALTRNGRVATLGWGIFGFFWLGQIDHYLNIDDYFNAVLFFLTGLLSFYMAWIMMNRGFSSKACYWVSYAASVCGLIYFPFAEIQSLQVGLIGFTTFLTARILQVLSIPVTLESWNIMSLNGRSVEIILACTAIESIALFAGVILSVQAPLGRKLKALAASTLSIYFLNIIRNGFVIMAYGWSWFGDESFDIAHNLIAKLGSTLALLAISYLVFMLLPELLSIIDELAAEVKPKRGDTA